MLLHIVSPFGPTQLHSIQRDLHLHFSWNVISFSFPDEKKNINHVDQ